MEFNYYYGSQADQFSFIRIPKIMLTGDTFNAALRCLKQKNELELMPLQRYAAPGSSDRDCRKNWCLKKRHIRVILRKTFHKL